jgi:hypothetical protein
MLHALLCVLAIDVQHVPPTAIPQDEPADGFAVHPLPFPGLGGFVPPLTAELQDGDILVWDGHSLRRFSAAGVLLQTLTTLPLPLFQGCFAVAPDESTCVIGESSAGDLFTVDLTTGTRTFLINLFFNYDAVFEAQDSLLVSAAVGGPNNEVWRVSLPSGSGVLLAEISGPSGPLDLDGSGNLYLGTFAPGFPPLPGGSEVLRFAAAELTGAPVLDASDADLLASGLDGVAELVVHPSGALFLADNFFGTGKNELLRLPSGGGPAELLMRGPQTPAARAISNLELQPPSGPAHYAPWQPPGGGVLRYQTSDFWSVFERKELVPARPTLALDGPGATGVGSFALELSDGPRYGFAAAFACPLSAYDPSEIQLPLPGALHPLFFGLRPPIQSLGVLPLGSRGRGALALENPAGAQGVIAFQALVLDASLDLVGTSAAASL